MDVAEAYSLISRAIDAGRAAHGYLVSGDVRGNAAELAGMVLEKIPRFFVRWISKKMAMVLAMLPNLRF